jgi:hypothetical protein
MSDQVLSAIPYWAEPTDPLAWDTLVLGGVTWPGVCDITGGGLVRKIDVKHAKGQDGATITDEGLEPAKLDITLTVYNQTDWQLLQELLPTVWPRKKGGERTPLEIVHPKAALLGIRYIYLTEVPIPEFDKAKQLLTVTLKCMEYVPQPAAPKKAAGTGTGGDEIKSRVYSLNDTPADKADEGMDEDDWVDWGIDE